MGNHCPLRPPPPPETKVRWGEEACRNPTVRGGGLGGPPSLKPFPHLSQTYLLIHQGRELSNWEEKKKALQEIQSFLCRREGLHRKLGRSSEETLCWFKAQMGFYKNFHKKLPDFAGRTHRVPGKVLKSTDASHITQKLVSISCCKGASNTANSVYTHTHT